MSSPARGLRVRVPLVASEAVQRARLQVVPRVRQRAPRVPFVVLVSLVLVAGLVGLLMFNTSMQQATFTSAALEDKADILAAREQTLRRELEALRDPQKVATRAQEMGMVVPAAPTFLNLEDGSITGPALPATAEDSLALEGAPPVKPAELEPERTVNIVKVPPADATAEATGPRRGNGDGVRNGQNRTRPNR